MPFCVVDDDNIGPPLKLKIKFEVNSNKRFNKLIYQYITMSPFGQMSFLKQTYKTKGHLCIGKIETMPKTGAKKELEQEMTKTRSRDRDIKYSEHLTSRLTCDQDRRVVECSRLHLCFPIYFVALRQQNVSLRSTDNIGVHD